MELVADTNIVVAAILRPGMTRRLIFYPGFGLHSPKRVVSEIWAHHNELVQKSQLSEKDYLDVVRIVLFNITLVPESNYHMFKEDAIAISPDYDDWPFFAVALQRNCAIWSNEKRLKNQKKVKVYNTGELFELLKQG